MEEEWRKNMATLNIKDFPDDLYSILRELARKKRRSLSSEVIFLIELALEAAQKKKKSILQLRCLGKPRWKGIGATKHVDTERKSWDQLGRLR